MLSSTNCLAVRVRRGGIRRLYAIVRNLDNYVHSGSKYVGRSFSVWHTIEYLLYCFVKGLIYGFLIVLGMVLLVSVLIAMWAIISSHGLEVCDEFYSAPKPHRCP
jgi:hypothetical protein